MTTRRQTVSPTADCSGCTYIIMPHFPERVQISTQLVKKNPDPFRSAPPALRVVITIGRGYHAQLRSRRQSAFVDIFRPARVVVRCNQQNLLPAVRSDEFAHR